MTHDMTPSRVDTIVAQAESSGGDATTGSSVHAANSAGAQLVTAGILDEGFGTGDVKAWAKPKYDAVDKMDAAPANAAITEITKRVGAPGDARDWQEELLLIRADAYGRLRDLGVEKTSNGIAAIHDVQEAAKKGDLRPVLAWARLLLAIWHKGMLARSVVAMKAGVAFDAEMATCMHELGKTTNDAMAQLVTIELATILKDEAAKLAAQGSLSKISDTDVAQARADLTDDGATT